MIKSDWISFQPATHSQRLSHTLVNDTGVTLVDVVTAAGHGVSHQRLMRWTLTLDQLIITAEATHGVPARAGTLILLGLRH